MLERGSHASLLAVGSMVETAMRVRTLLEEQGVSVSLVNCSTVKPLDLPLLRRLTQRPYVTLEEHMLTGGFGAAVCEACAREKLAPPALMIGIPDIFVQHGSRRALMEMLELRPEQIARRIMETLRSNQA